MFNDSFVSASYSNIRNKIYFIVVGDNSLIQHFIISETTTVRFPQFPFKINLNKTISEQKSLL